MLFNSVQFLVFFAVVYPGYLLLSRQHRAQNAWLLVASLVFYAAWDVRFLALLGVSSGIDFVAGLKIANSESPQVRKRWLVLSIVSNLVILGFFKYFNFFLDNAWVLHDALGMAGARPILSVALPIGISFYTFQAISYVIDVYKSEIPACRSALDYALFISFFPHLVAGPIQHPQILLPQVLRPRTIRSQSVQAGIYLILWGLVQKVVIADNVAPIVSEIFDNYQQYQGLDLVAGALAFTVQIYGDFAGYSDIARGLSKLMGFELMVNFNLPYFASSPSDFWERWHISLSSWLRKYLYFSLGGNRNGSLLTYRNLFLTMLLGGLWHGAAWNFVLWGAYHGLLLIAYRLVEGRFPQVAAMDNTVAGRIPRIAVMFCFTVFGWVLFRCHSAAQIGWFVTQASLVPGPATVELLLIIGWYALPLLGFQLLQYVRKNALVLTRLPAPLLGMTYGMALVLLLLYGVRESTEFIYFQF